MKKKLLVVASLILSVCLLLTISAKASGNNLPAEQNGKITLTEDVTLSTTFNVDSSKTLTIDLNGHTLTGPSSNYTIVNEGNLTIVDTGSKKGKIVGENNTASCIQNKKELKLDGVTVETKGFGAIKNEDKTTLTVTNSNLSSSYNPDSSHVGGVIINYGSATVTNTTLSATSLNMAAVTAANDSTSNADSTITLNNCELNSRYSVFTDKQVADKKVEVNVNGGNLQGIVKNNKSGSEINVSGNVKVSSLLTVLRDTNVKSGANLEITVDTKLGNPVTVPEGVTVTIPEGKKLTFASQIVVNGKINGYERLEKNNLFYNEAKKKYYSEDYLERAFSEAEEGESLKLLGDTTLTKKKGYDNEKNVTIDLNGHTLNTGTGINNEAKGKLTITDSSKSTNGKVVGEIENEGEITLGSADFSELKVKGDENKISVNNKYNELVRNEDGSFSTKVKPADYTKVEEAIKKLESLKSSEYKNFGLVELALSAIDYNKTALDQDEVDGYAKAIEDAIAKLEKKDGRQDDTPDTGTFNVYTVLGLASIVALAGIIVLNKRK